ncbi:hypothetical protein R4Z09_13685 [Niallia oryzisoli]|uniref:Uncharacterized protein n=1 Tax=Niallia oryzisoli TaxID=1737571 RepID=A0ABZ2CS53_9BACI
MILGVVTLSVVPLGVVPFGVVPFGDIEPDVDGIDVVRLKPG